MNQRPLQEMFDAMFHGKYRFEEFLELKPVENYSAVQWSGRTIYKPTKKLKEFHAFLSVFLLEHLPVNETVSFAYRKGATLLQAVTPHAQSRAFYQTDLERFFDSFNTNLIRVALENSVSPVIDLPKHIDQIVSLLTINERLPIGYSTSPILSNVCFRGFDERLSQISEEKNWIYTRYSDDIIISASDRQNLVEANAIITDCLAKEFGEGFSLNSSKSKLTTIGRKIKILGLVILPNGAVVLDREVKSKIETWLHFYITDRARLVKIFEEQDDEFEEGLERLSGLVSYASATDTLYMEKLRAKFGNTVIDSFLHRSAQ